MKWRVKGVRLRSSASASELSSWEGEPEPEAILQGNVKPPHSVGMAELLNFFVRLLLRLFFCRRRQVGV